MADKAAGFVVKRAFKAHGKSKDKGTIKLKGEDQFYYMDMSRARPNKHGELIGTMKVKDTDYYVTLGIPTADAKRLANMKWRARILDGKMRIFGVRVGVNTLIGVMPVGGDAIDGLLSLVLINSSRKVSGGLDAGTRNKMLMNVVLEVIIGFTPVLGNFADIFFRCNTKNAALLEEMLKKRVDKAILQADKTGQYGGRLEDRRDYTVPPARPMRPLHGINPHGDQGRYAIEQPVKQESGGWKSGLGLQDGSAKEKSWRSYGALAQSQTNGVVGQQGRKVIGAHDL